MLYFINVVFQVRTISIRYVNDFFTYTLFIHNIYIIYTQEGRVQYDNQSASITDKMAYSEISTANFQDQLQE